MMKETVSSRVSQIWKIFGIFKIHDTFLKVLIKDI